MQFVANIVHCVALVPVMVMDWLIASFTDMALRCVVPRVCVALARRVYSSVDVATARALEHREQLTLEYRPDAYRCLQQVTVWLRSFLPHQLLTPLRRLRGQKRQL